MSQVNHAALCSLTIFSSRTSPGVQLVSDKVSDSLRQENSRDLIAPVYHLNIFASSSSHSESQEAKKATQTGIRMLTSEKYVAELSALAETTPPSSFRKTTALAETMSSSSSKKVAAPRKKKENKRKNERHERYCYSNLCAVCNGNFFDDKEDEGWIQCQKCQKWLHDICAGIYGKHIVSFQCDDSSA